LRPAPRILLTALSVLREPPLITPLIVAPLGRRLRMRRVIIDTELASLSIKNRLPPALLRELVGAQVGNIHHAWGTG
jgi:hypothetical protein